MQNMETARCYQLQYDELELGRLHVTLPPKLFEIGQTWAPTPLPFREVKMVLALTQRCLSVFRLVDRLWDRGSLYLPFVKHVGLEEVRTGLTGLW
jgi:hypothetical protein